MPWRSCDVDVLRSGLEAWQLTSEDICLQFRGALEETLTYNKPVL